MKICRFTALLLTVLLLAALLSACGAPESGEEGKLRIVATVFPEYDWVRSVLGERERETELTLLLDNGVDLHSYQPTAADIIRLSECDLFLCVGGESDEWVEDALKEATNENMVVLNLMDVLGSAVREEEVKEGMEAEPECGEEDGIEYDEHVWLSLRNAAVIVGAIRDALIGLDAEHAEEYSANAAAYLEELDALDGRYRAAVEAAPCRTLLFGDRFPFRYLTDDYGLDYYAAFVGCSAESEASFETVTFLADKLDELDLTAVLTLEGSDGKLAETVVAASAGKSARILTVDSMQSTTAEDIRSGATYLSIMEMNLGVFADALG